jgi:hypothetical protein
MIVYSTDAFLNIYDMQNAFTNIYHSLTSQLFTSTDYLYQLFTHSTIHVSNTYVFTNIMAQSEAKLYTEFNYRLITTNVHLIDAAFVTDVSSESSSRKFAVI